MRRGEDHPLSVVISPSLTGIEAAALLESRLLRCGNGTEVHGVWQGRAASRMGLVDRAAPDAIRDLLAGTGSTRAPWMSGRGAAAWILTVVAPPSVVRFACEDADSGLVSAHDGAVRASLARAEDVARALGDAVLTRALVAAVFPHRYDSAGARALEQRILLLNLTCPMSGSTTRELDYAVPYDVRHAVETAYDSELAARLRTLGYGLARSGVTSVEIASAPTSGPASESGATRHSDREARSPLEGDPVRTIVYVDDDGRPVDGPSSRDALPARRRASE